ncbi:uncharacterized protein LOC126235298 [Schistocerca nitens]|uniref:uncharacterized protein LOC126235298 n=1 Tax=Schistocerca nitens TaxID=7011 RepID=UPI0021197FD5|nr:uncharacterized protein LOC126235298 [Schistocerca nitens]
MYVADDVILTRQDLETQVQSWTIEINEASLIKMDTFRWLSYRLQSYGSVYGDVRSRIKMTWMRFRAVIPIICEKTMPIRLKSKTYRKLKRSVALYGQKQCGRPKLRWLDIINADLRSRNLNRQETQNLKKWHALSHKAEPTPMGRH